MSALVLHYVFAWMTSGHTDTFDVEVWLSENARLGISVIKEQNGWLVQRVKAGIIDVWNRLHSDRAVGVGDRLLSANGAPLRHGMEASDYLVDGRLLLCVSKASTISFEGRTGVITWDAGRVDPCFVKVRWDDETESGMLRQKGQWKFISRKIADAFIGEPAVVDLSARNLGDEGADQVASILECSGLSVASLCLNRNNIRDHGATRIAEAIVHSNVVQVDMFSNWFSKEFRDNIDELLYFRNRRLMLVSVCGVQEDAQIKLSFLMLSGEEIFESLVMNPSDTVEKLRKTLESRTEARKRQIMLLLPAPRSRELRDSEIIAQVVKQ